MPRLIRAATRTAVVAGTATAVSGRVARRQNDKWSQQQAEQQAQQAAPAPQAAPPAPAPSSADDQIAQLKRLEELKTAGVISEAEYESQRKKVLGF
ncbi:MAG: hypothetical protein CMH41_02180 [Micrococcales bacterium]|jgi:hypothetical protein|nr:hypothetical protein [Micrococcales bacterium]